MNQLLPLQRFKQSQCLLALCQHAKLPQFITNRASAVSCMCINDVRGCCRLRHEILDLSVVSLVMLTAREDYFSWYVIASEINMHCSNTSTAKESVIDGQGKCCLLCSAYFVVHISIFTAFPLQPPWLTNIFFFWKCCCTSISIDSEVSMNAHPKNHNTYVSSKACSRLEPFHASL